MQQAEKCQGIILKQNGMNTSENSYDPNESIIIEEGLRIEVIDFHHELDVMLIVLNTKAVLQRKISDYPLLKDADLDSLRNYKLIGAGTGVHWSSLDEDLSLKGFLKDELRNVVKKGAIAA